MAALKMSDTFDDGASQDQADFFTGVGSDRKTTEKARQPSECLLLF